MPDPRSTASFAHLPLVKGRALVDTIAVIREAFGEAALQRAIDTLDPTWQYILGGKLLMSDWYPLDAMTALMSASLELNEAGDESRLVARSEAAIARQLGGVYQLFIRLGSPEWIIKQITTVHETYFRNVRISPSMGERRARIRYEGFEPHHRVLELTIVGFYRKALELSGAKEREVRFTTSVAAGMGFSELDLSWS